MNVTKQLTSINVNVCTNLKEMGLPITASSKNINDALHVVLHYRLSGNSYDLGKD